MGFLECKDQGNPGPDVGFKVDNGNAEQTGP